MNILSTQGINKLISSYGINERFKRVHPLQLRKNKFTDLSKVWNDLSSKLTSLKSNLSGLKDNSVGNTFASKAVELSSNEYFTASATSSAALSSYDIKINQLAKNDMVMSDTQTSDSAAGLSVGTYTFQVASGEFDLSVGSIIALTALVGALVLQRFGIILALISALAVGAAVGAVNGFFVVKARMPSFLATIATMGIIHGFARWITISPFPFTFSLICSCLSRARHRLAPTWYRTFFSFESLICYVIINN